MELEDFKIGDIIVITSKMRYGTQQRCAQVTNLNYNNLGLVQLGPCKYKGFTPHGYGSFNPADVGSKQFGKQKIEFVGRVKIRSIASFHGPYPGNPGYDLMC